MEIECGAGHERMCDEPYVAGRAIRIYQANSPKYPNTRLEQKGYDHKRVWWAGPPTKAYSLIRAVKRTPSKE